MNQPENTIPFSLEKWKEGYEVVCRDGTVPSELHYLETADLAYQILAVLHGVPRFFYITGRMGKAYDHYQDLFLRPKMETWYRRAYWEGQTLMYAKPQPFKNSQSFDENYFLNAGFNTDHYKWAGPVEEFQVPAREK